MDLIVKSMVELNAVTNARLLVLISLLDEKGIVSKTEFNERLSALTDEQIYEMGAQLRKEFADLITTRINAQNF